MAFVSQPVPVALDHTDPSPHQPRVALLRALTLLLFAALLARLWVLQVVRRGEAERMASRNLVRIEPTAAPRGAVFDRQGTLLATNRLSHRVAILDLAGSRTRRARHLFAVNAAAPGDAALVGMPNPTLDEQLKTLAELLALTTEEMSQIRAGLNDPQRPKFAPVTVRDDADPEALTRVEERLWELPSVVIEPVPMRRYPLGRVTAHLLGYVGSISPDELAARRAEQAQAIAALAARIDLARRTWRNTELPKIEAMTQQLRVLERLRNQVARTVGKTGLEASHEQDLVGEPGMQTWQVNARNQPVRLVASSNGRAGHSLVLNLDARLQRLAAEQMGGRRGSVVAMDPRDGAVLVLYSSPTYDPNAFVPRIAPAVWKDIVTDGSHPLENRALRAAYPPGSTFKGIVGTAAGLKAGAITTASAAVCSGGMQIGGRFKKCWQTHGGVGLTAAIAQSCDVFFYQAALRMGPTPIIAMATAFGLGVPTGIDLPDERGGGLPDPARHKRKWKREWYGGDSANTIIGQGDVNTTSLQVCRMTAVVANGGTVHRPQVVREVRRREGDVVRRWAPEVQGRAPLNTAQIGLIRAGMRAAVVSGTARIVDLPGIPVAAKTGSAEDGTRRLPHAWFVAFAPSDAPTIAVCVMVENAGHGATEAGPVARALLAAWFRQQGMLP